MYKLIKNPNKNIIDMVLQIIGNIESFIPFAVDNTDYANFKREILADEAQLQDADGNLMTPEAAKEFIGTLP